MTVNDLFDAFEVQGPCEIRIYSDEEERYTVQVDATYKTRKKYGDLPIKCMYPDVKTGKTVFEVTSEED